MLSLPLLIFMLSLWGNTGFSQTITVSVKNVTPEELITTVKQQTSLVFLYDKAVLRNSNKITVSVANMPLREFLTLAFTNQPFTWTLMDKTVVLKRKEPVRSSVPATAAVTGAMPSLVAGIIKAAGDVLVQDATIQIKKKHISVVSDANGRFSIPALPGDLLLITHVNFEPREYPIPESGLESPLMIELMLKTAVLNETVIIGYGTTDRVSNTGSVSKYKPKPVGAATLSIDGMMSGKMAGVQVLPSGGAPGSATNIVIRGLSTFSKDGNSPLIVVDGIPIYGMGEESNSVDFKRAVASSSSSSGGGASVNFNAPNTFEKNPLANINPDDVSSIEVLKDAYATAIYGSRGAAGVILITTKRGRPGSTRINAQVSSAVSEVFGSPKLMNGDQYAEFYTAYLKAFDPSNSRSFPQGVNTNWVKKMIRKPLGMSADVNISGGKDKSAYYVSFGYDDHPSYIIKNDFKRIQGRINVDQQVGKALKIGANVMLTSIRNSALSSQVLYMEAIRKAPNLEIYLPDNTYNWGYLPNPTGSFNEDLNPVGKAMRNINYAADTRMLGNLFAELKIAPWLTLRSELGSDWVDNRAYSRYKSSPRLPAGSADETVVRNRKYVINNILTANKQVGSYHKFNVVAGQSFESTVENTVGIHAEGFGSDDILSLVAATNKTVSTAIQRAASLFSVFGRLDYQFMGRYLLGATYRVDGSSRFSKNNRFMGFPSFSAGWIINKELFMEDLSWVDLLKVRASIGFSGTDRSAGYYGNQGQYNYAVGTGGDLTYGNMRNLRLLKPNNPNLKWENVRTVNAGLDVSLWKSGLTIAFDYYNKRTSDAVLSVAVPDYMGFSIQEQNLAVIRNNGWELDIKTNIIQGKNFRWNTSFNIARNRNKIISIKVADPTSTAQDVENQLFNGTQTNNFWLPGFSTTTFFLYEWAGVDPQTGNPLWKYRDGKISDIPPMRFPDGYLNRKPMGDAMPVVSGGISNNIVYKAFELDFTFSYALGNKIYNGSKAQLYSYIGKAGSFLNENVYNLSPDMLNYWKKPGQITDIPALKNNSNDQFNDFSVTRQSDRFLENGSFVKLRDLVLAYNFQQNSRLMRSLRLTSGKIFVQGQNLLLFTGYSGIDPEVSAFGGSAIRAGYDELTLPGIRSYRIGLNLGF